MNENVKIRVESQKIEGPRGTPLLKVLLAAGFDIPNLCYHEKLEPYASCRLCLVEVAAPEREGRRLVTSCNYPLMDGLEVFLDTPRVIEERRSVFEVLLAQAPMSTRLRNYAARYGVTGTTLRIQEGECILCGLCQRVCSEVIGAYAIDFAGRGAHKEITTPFGGVNTACIGCGACASLCPTGRIRIIDRERVREIPFLQAKFDLAACRSCGKLLATQAHLEYLRKRGVADEATLSTCEECKRRSFAKIVQRGMHAKSLA